MHERSEEEAHLYPQFARRMCLQEAQIHLRQRFRQALELHHHCLHPGRALFSEKTTHMQLCDSLDSSVGIEASFRRELQAYFIR